MKAIKILLIEDDGDDIDLLKDAFEMNGISCRIDVVTEGDRVMPHLEEAHDRPDVIVMDLNLPKLHGREIMKELKSHEQFSSIPIVVLTTSSFQDDKDFAYSMGVDRYITKPNTIEGFNSTVQAIVGVSQTK